MIKGSSSESEGISCADAVASSHIHSILLLLQAVDACSLFKYLNKKTSLAVLSRFNRFLNFDFTKPNVEKYLSKDAVDAIAVSSFSQNFRKFSFSVGQPVRHDFHHTNGPGLRNYGPNIYLGNGSDLDVKAITNAKNLRSYWQ